MRQTTAEMAARFTGQPPEIYLDDSRSDERKAEVVEVDEIDYPVDSDDILARMRDSDRRMLVLSDGVRVHFFKEIAGRATEVTVSDFKDRDAVEEFTRVLRVYRMNCRFDDDWERLDILKGLVLASKGLQPSNRFEAEKSLHELSLESGHQIDPKIRDWEPVGFALDTILQYCPDPDPGLLGRAYINLFNTADRNSILGTDATCSIMSSFVETTSSMAFFNPYVACFLPYGSIKSASISDSELSRLFCILMGVEKTVCEPALPDPAETIIACIPLQENRNRDDALMGSVLDIIPEGGRIVALCTTSIMFGIRAGAFRSRVASECHLTHVSKIEHGFGNAVSIPATVMVIDRNTGSEPTEFVSVPNDTAPDGDWRAWPGLKFNKTFVDDDDWMGGFAFDCSIIMRDGVKLGTIASVRKGSMMRSDKLFPPRAASGIPFLTPKNLVDGELDISTARRAPSSVCAVARPGDILLTCNGPIGRVYRMKRSDPIVAPSNSFAIIHPDTDQYIPEFLELFFHTDDFRDQIESSVTGSMMRSLSNDSIRDIIVPIETLDSQMGKVDEYRASLDSGTPLTPDEIVFGPTDDE